jgi:hypothetical protein
MKKAISLLALVLVLCGTISATGAGNFVPYHVYLQQHAADLQNSNGVQRSIVYQEIAYRHDGWTAGWVGQDSENYVYNQQGYLIEDSNYTFAQLAWALQTKTVYSLNALNHHDTVITFAWNSVGGNYVNKAITVFTYNTAGNPVLESTQEWGNNGWQNYLNQYSIWDTVNNNQTGEIIQFWDTVSNTYVNYELDLFAFDNNHNQTVQTYAIWNTVTSTWDSTNKSLYTYVDLHTRQSQTVQIYKNGAWVNYTKQSYTFNGNVTVISQLYQTWDTLSAQWLNNDTVSYQVNAAGKDTQSITYLWNSLAQQWFINNELFTVYNAAGKELSFTQQIYDTATQEYGISYMGTYSYDANNNDTLYQYFTHPEGNNLWQPDSRVLYKYDTYNNNIYELDQTYTNSQFNNTNQYFYYYQSFNVASVNEQTNQVNAAIYPNPSATGNNITLAVQLNQSANLQINIYDADGRLMSTETHAVTQGETRMQITNNYLSPGCYYLQVLNRTQNQSSVLGFVKQ